ncbi:hypothetical protein BV20DRAFT_824697 [Pilatotrama ljubarskyi]|nr:hypothetical protein BV20DRAFT_824697 [Pilatotrama ljubarskyi]
MQYTALKAVFTQTIRGSFAHPLHSKADGLGVLRFDALSVGEAPGNWYADRPVSKQNEKEEHDIDQVLGVWAESDLRILMHGWRSMCWR